MMNTEAVEEMLFRRALLQDTILFMKEAKSNLMYTPDGPVPLSHLISEAKSIDLMIIDELDEVPVSAFLINLLN